jgi:hypothetical protein
LVGKNIRIGQTEFVGKRSGERASSSWATELSIADLDFMQDKIFGEKI